MSIKSFYKSILFLSLVFLFAVPAFGAKEGAGNTTANGCTINNAYLGQNNLRIRFSINRYCGSIEVFDSLGNTHLSFSASNPSALYYASSEENGLVYVPISYIQTGNPVTFTIRAHNPNDWWDYSETSVTYGGGYSTGCILNEFSYTVSSPSIPNRVNYTYVSNANGYVCVPVFNGVQNLNSPITSNFQSGINTMAVWAVPPGLGVGSPGSFVSDYVAFNYPGGSGSGGGGAPDTAIDVSVTGLADPNSASWSISPGSYSGSGNSSVNVTSTVLDGRTYTISPNSVPGCSVTVSNTDGGGSSMTVYPGNSKGFNIFYSCVNPPTVDIKADNSDGPVFLTSGQSSNLTWTSTNATSCSASGSWSGSKSTSGNQTTGALTTGTYTYTLTCNNGATFVSDFVEINVSGTPPPAPTITASTSGTCASVDISWSGYNTSLSTGFKVYRNGVLIATLGNQTSYTDSGLSAGSYTYTVRAFNGVGDSPISNSSSASASAQCAGSAPAVTLSANPMTTDSNSTLTWTTTNSPSSCTASNNSSLPSWSGGKSTAGGSQTITNITATTTFSLYCTNAFGQSLTRSVTVNYRGNTSVAPVVTLTASPNPVSEGFSSVLTWSATNNPTSCTASGGHPQWSGSITPPSGGTKTITNISSADVNLFRLQCTNGKSSNIASVTINVTSDPVPLSVAIRANPSSVTSGGNTVLTWDPVLNATNCTANTFNPINGQWSGQSKSVSGGTQTITNLTQTTNFTLACTNSNNGSSGSGSALVTVTPATATLNVTSNNSSGSWSISPGGIVGSGTSGNSTVTPNSAGTVYTISPNSISGYTATVLSTRNGVSGGGSAVTVFPGDTVTYAITYTASGPTFNYTLSNPGNITITKGSSPVTGQVNTSKLLTQGTTQLVDTDITGLPSGVSVTYANKSCNPNPSCTTGITFTVDPSAAVGTYPLVLRGISSGLADKTQNFNLVIANATPLSVNVSSNPSSTARVGDTVTWTCTASGGSGSYTYTWSGTGIPSPAPTTSSFTITYQTVGSKTAVCTVNDGTQSAGSLERAVQVSVNPIFIEF